MWSKVPLGDVAMVSWGDTSTTKAAYTPDGFPAFSASGLDGMLPHADHSEQAVVLSAIGAQCGKTWLTPSEWSCIKNTMWFRARDDCAVTPFLYYATADPAMWPRRGAAQPFVSLRDAREMEVSLPPLGIQRKIVAILSAYDDLIENNSRRIKVLEEMAQRIYREWFVEFRYPGHEGVPTVESDLGPMPEGWDLCGLFDVADVTFGFPFKSAHFNTVNGVPVIRIRDIPTGSSATLTTETPSASYTVSNGDILVGMDGEFHMARWSAGRAWLNQRVARFRPTSSRLSRYALYLALEEPIARWNATIVGTTVAHLGKRHLQLVKVAVPPAGVAAHATALLDPIFDEEVLLRRVIRSLRTARDLLLPRLISGELDVTDVDIDVSGLAS